MFTCNSLILLNFTYYLKLLLGFCMIIIPFITLEFIVIKIIRHKIKNGKIDKLFIKGFIKKESKLIFRVFILFIAAFSINNILNNKDNKCYMYAKKEIIEEYKENYKALNDTDLSKSVKEKYLENVLVIAYSNYNNKYETTTNKKETLNKSLNTKDETVKNEIKVEDNIMKETDTRKLNSVYVKNGVFYYPKYKGGNKTTYSGMYCPTNPLNQGFNNKYGYNNYFYIRLTNMIEDAKKNGYKITISTQGCRSYQTQVNYYRTMEKGRAISPGHSMHGFGIASDLEFYDKNGKVCPYGRTDSSCPSMGWAHKNAYKYGLTFNLLYASYREDWHVEPIKTKTY